MSALAYRSDPIAVVGISGRTSGCDSLDAVWEMLAEGRDAISQSLPDDRPGILPWPEDIPQQAAYLDNIDSFDAELFGVSPREAAEMDPQQRLMLETVWRLLEDSGTPAENLSGKAVGVFMGGLWRDYELLRAAQKVPLTQHSTVGSSLDILSARISYFLGTRGQSLTVESSCSSSLVAVHLACAALSRGEIEQAIVGASNLALTPQTSEGLSLFGGLSPNGQCRPFDADANGFVRGEGILAIQLKPLSKALQDDDRIHACIHASGTNNDGGGESLVTPNSAAQEQLLREVYDTLGANTEDLAYVEAHGTGTQRGDSAEAKAVGKVLGRPHNPLRIGSLKSSIGHLEPAAGLAGLLKLILSLRHGFVPETRNCRTLNPNIPFSDLGLTVVRDHLVLPSTKNYFMGVNSFGWGGTNAHVVVAPAPAKEDRAAAPDKQTERDSLTFRFSAPSPRALDDVVEAWSTYLDDIPGEEVLRAAEELNRHRSSLAERGCVILSKNQLIDNPGSAIRQIWQGASTGKHIAPIRGKWRPTELHKPQKVAFVLPGQGAQRAAMAAGMAEVPAFHEQLRQCCDALAPWLQNIDIYRLLTNPADTYWLEHVELVQPALWAINTALAAAWNAEGVVPDIVIGHSQGELAAATFAGILSVEDGARIVAERSRILRSISGQGKMLSVHTSPFSIQNLLLDFSGIVDIAVESSPNSCVLSGDTDAILLIKEILEVEDIFCRLVNVDYASHSHHVDQLSNSILEAIKEVRHHPGSIPMLSTVDLKMIDGDSLTPEYWIRNLRSPVRLAGAVEELCNQNLTHAVEISPHPNLTASLMESVPSGRQLAILPTLRRDADRASDFYSAVASAWASGVPVDSEKNRTTIRDYNAPGYPFRRRSFWLDDGRVQHTSAVEDMRLDQSHVLGQSTATLPISLNSMHWLKDHAIGSDPVLPAAVSLALAFQLLSTNDSSSFQPANVQLDDIAFREPLVLSSAPTLLSVTRTRHAGVQKLQVNSDTGPIGLKLNHFNARYADSPERLALSQNFANEVDVVRVSTERFYEQCATRGIHYGSEFQVLDDIGRSPHSVRARVTLTPRATNFPSKIDPILVDGILQTALALAPENPDVIPANIGSIICDFDNLFHLRELIAVASTNKSGTIDIQASSLDGKIVAKVYDLVLKPLSSRSTHDNSIHLVEQPSESTPLTDTDCLSPEPSNALILCVSRDNEYALDISKALPGVDTFDVSDITAEGLATHLPLEAERIVIPIQRGQLEPALRIMQTLSHRTTPTRVELIARGSIPCTPASDPLVAGLFGIFSVAQNEHPQIRLRLLDLDDAASKKAIQEWWRDTADLATVRGGVYSRVVRKSGAKPDYEASPEMRLGSDPLFRIAPRRVGDLSSVGCELEERVEKIPPRSVRVRVEASSLNFIDVLKAADFYPDTHGEPAHQLGLESSGEIIEIGPEVDRFKVGDKVVCCSAGAMSSELLVDDSLVRTVPTEIDLTKAAALPMVFVTAWHALVDLARVDHGDLVLVHSGAGGLGLAAIQVALLQGARVVATAGTRTKRNYLHEMGVEAVFDSRSTSWADELLEKFPHGVDVVLNSLTGNQLVLGLDVLNIGGRFIEVGKRDIYGDSALPLAAFSRMLTFSSVDVTGLLASRPAKFSKILDKVWPLFESGRLHALPTAVYDYSQATDAFRKLASGEAIGKIVLSNPQSTHGIIRPRPKSKAMSSGVHLITGGLGSMGLATAEYLVTHGVTKLALLTRSPASDEAMERVNAMRDKGAHTVIYACDVGNRAELSDCLSKIRREIGPPTGIYHTAGVLADATFGNVTAESLELASHGKLVGSLLLDELTREDPIEIFALFSSCAALLGSPGQAAYAFANAGLDALAFQRRTAGLPGISIMWPPIHGAGLGERTGGAARLTRLGWSSLSIQDVGATLARLIAANEVCVAPMSVDFTRWSESFPTVATLSSWSEIAQTSTSEETSGGESRYLASLNRDDLVRHLNEEVINTAAQVIRTDAADLDSGTPLRAVGLDSLMTLELRSALEKHLGLKLSPSLLWKHSSPRDLAEALAELVKDPQKE